MSLGQWVDGVLPVLRNNLPVTVGGGVAGILLMLLFVQHLRRRRRPGPDATAAATGSGSGSASGNDRALNWAPPEQSYADRRGSVRREGVPVRVALSSPTFRNGVNDGFVVDRSTGGLRIVTQAPIAPGSTLQVRAANAPDTVGFVGVIVRSCRKNGDHFEVGCEFEATPPWNVLLLFG